MSIGRSTNVPLYEAPTPCPRCGVPRTINVTAKAGRLCASCTHVTRTKTDTADLALTGGRWQLDPRTRIQRWTAA